jgi:general stress protein CsbA
MSGILKCLLVALFAGLVFGLWVTATAVSLYEAPVDPAQTLAERESTRGRAVVQFATTVFLISLAVVAIPTYFIGNPRLPRATRPVVLGALVGVVVVFAAAHVTAYARNEWPFRGKSPTTSLDWARYVGIPLGVVLGGAVGYSNWRWRRNKPAKPEYPLPGAQSAADRPDG